MKPICYLDIDGVLYHYPTEEEEQAAAAEIRPYLLSLLNTIAKGGFELRLLTANPSGGKSLLKAAYHSGFWPRPWVNMDLESIPQCYHNKQFFNGTKIDMGLRYGNPSKIEDNYTKSGFIDLKRDFIWIEDGISKVEKQFLEERGLLDRYCYVDPKPRDELLRVIQWIKKHRLYEPLST